MNRALFLGLGCLGVIVVILLIFGGAIAGGYNSLVQSSTSVDGSWAQVQTQYQRRADLIPNLVRTVEGAANFEKTTLTDVVNARHKNVADALAEATRCFKKFKMDRTALRNDVLIFVAPRSHSFAVVGDVGVHAKCGEGFWNEVVEAMRPRLQHGDFTDALVHGIERVGSLLADHFPATSDRKHPSGGVVED